jgi:N-acetylglucosaminyldiphosphoundecaprenol N-acetyl-beta-D-mannosaminyltransferase
MASFELLGVRVDAIDLDEAASTIERWIDRRERRYVCLANVHGIMECHRDPELRRIYNDAGLSVPDGMPLVWLSWRQGFAGVGRVYGPELVEEMCRRSESRGYRHYLYGGATGVAERRARRLHDRFPRLQIAGWRTPPFGDPAPEEEELAIREIEASRADLIWVGLGTAKQDRFLSRHYQSLPGIAIGVGAAFDFLSGTKRQAPRWMRQSGLEWLFRLASEPRRLWRRYLLDNPEFLWRVITSRFPICFRRKRE